MQTTSIVEVKFSHMHIQWKLSSKLTKTITFLQRVDNPNENPLHQQCMRRQELISWGLGNKPLQHFFWPGANIRRVRNYSRNITVPIDSPIPIRHDVSQSNGREEHNCRGVDLNTIFGDVSSTDFDVQTEEE